MKTKRTLKNLLLSLIIVCLTVGMIPIQYVRAATSELPKPTPVLFPFINEEDLKAKIINSPEFIQNHALFAHYLGFGWCGGTGSQYVGQDFDFKKDGDNYVLQARYNANNPYAGGYWADKRLKMTVSNVRFYIDPDSVVTGKEKITSLDPQIAQQYIATNRGDSDDKASTSFNYTKSKTVSHSTNYSFQEGIHVKHTAKISVLFLEGSMEYGWNFSANQGWSDTTTDVDSSTVTTSYDTTIPAKSKKTIKLMSYKTKSEVPYTANIYMDYDITFSGFLRWGGNARSDHPGDRPFVNVTFGSGDIAAPEAIANMYTNRSIPGYSNWDWGWMEREYGANNVKSLISSLATRPKGAKIDGKFSCVDGTHVEVVADEAIPLTPEELGTNTFHKDLNNHKFGSNLPAPKGTTIENVQYGQDQSGIHVNSSVITTESGKHVELTNPK